jgi:DNA-binding NtrC family response regulator
MSRTLLVVDDEAPVRFTLNEVLSEHGYGVIACASGEEALARLDAADVLITDLVMPHMTGLELMRAARAKRPHLPVLVLTARGSERAAVEVMKAGAEDYLSKPFDVDELLLSVQRCVETQRLREGELEHLAERSMGQPIIGDSATLRGLLARAGRVATRNVTVLIQGESGTGKELIAAFIHARSPRNGRAFVRFNSAALPAQLAEAELFGHARGAFTGAAAARPGFVRQAEGGTLVLDEVGELPLELQAKLLRLLQDGEVQPLGTARVEKVDVRILACTNKNLRQEVARGTFRPDLFYRLAVVELAVPPLSERREDIPALARSLAAKYAERFAMTNVRLAPELLAHLVARQWPGNVRELENCIARMLAFSKDGTLTLEDLNETEPPGAPRSSFRAQVALFERQLLERTLLECGGNQSEAARRLDLTRVTLIDKMKRYNLHRQGRTRAH